MADYKPLEVFSFPTVSPKVTADTLYWKRLGFSVAFKEYGSIDFIDFAHQEPYNFAVTCSSKVQIYNPVENKIVSTLSKFKKTAYGGVFRKDGKLLAAGSEDGFIRLFQVQFNRTLRIFKGHTAATHRCNFVKGGTHIVSFSDDKSIGLWDIPTETRILKLEEHKDYVRAGTVCETSQHTFLSGSYDHTVKMYDVRTSSCVMTVDHGAPVEAVIMFPSGGIFISAGGTDLKVWDPIAGRLLSQVIQHHKTITSLCFASDGKRLMSGSLDRHVKIYDVTSYEVVHTLDYPSPILSVSASPDDKVVAVGMVDGLLSVRHQKPPKDVEKEQKVSSRKTIDYRYRFYGTDFRTTEVDVIVPQSEKKKYKMYDKYLKQFESTRALDSVLRNQMLYKHPEVTVTVMNELIKRKTLKAAMAGREGSSLLPLLKFVTKYIGDPRFARVMIKVASMLVDIYGPTLNNPETRKMFELLLQAMENEDRYIIEMMEMQGMMQAVLTAVNNNLRKLSENDSEIFSSETFMSSPIKSV